MRIHQLGRPAAFLPRISFGLTLCFALFFSSAAAPAQDPPAQNPAPAAQSGEAKPEAGDASKAADKPVREGHSYHGEVFNEGPRQAAYLIDGVGIVRFPVTTASDDARKFFEQGVAQLHGFWYFESERSFRQAAMIDPEMAMALLGHGAFQQNQY